MYRQNLVYSENEEPQVVLWTVVGFRPVCTSSDRRKLCELPGEDVLSTGVRRLLSPGVGQFEMGK